MRRGKQAGPFAYRSITLRELEGLGLPGPRHAPNTEGTLPPLVANAHHDLFLTEMAQAERLDHFLSTRPVQELSLLAVLEEQVRIHNDELVIGATRKNIRDRILKMGKQLPEVLPLVDRLRSC
ncbi:MAG: hypothetical protein HY721_00030 [Planctomycetes bacterium]|nr:hypothetical protein [Planctomycetota bacterium]